MTIAFLNHPQVIGGAERVLHRVVTHCSRAGHECVLIGPPESQSSHVPGARVIGLFHDFSLKEPLLLPKLASYNRQLRRVLGELRPSLLYVNSLKSLLFTLPALGRRTPLIFHLHDIWDDRVTNPVLNRALVSLLRRRVRQIVCVSRTVYDSVPVDPASKTLVYNGVEVPRMVVSPPRGEVRRVALVGRFAPWKGQLEFVRAAARVHAARPATRFTLVGDALFGEDAYRDRVLGAVREEGLEEVLDRVGNVDNVAKYMDSADVVVHASTRREPFGLVIAEAMARGRPVVASRHGGGAEIVLDGQTGLLVDPGNPEAFAEAILGLVDDPERAARMGWAGHARARERFDQRRMLEEIERVLESVSVNGRRS